MPVNGSIIFSIVSLLILMEKLSWPELFLGFKSCLPEEITSGVVVQSICFAMAYWTGVIC